MVFLLGSRVIANAKLVNYLLDPAHPVGGPKARYFLAHGFSRDDPSLLAAALLRHASRHPIHATIETAGGLNHELRCRIETPDGRDPCIRVIWHQAHGEMTCRLATAYPLKPQKKASGPLGPDAPRRL